MQICELLESRRLFSGAGLDPSFGTGGAIADVLGQGNYRITTTAVQPGGRLLVGGYHTEVGKSGTIPFLLRFKTNGQLDDRFTGNATVARFAKAELTKILVAPDGRLDVAIADNGGGGVGGIFGLTVSGKLDTSVQRITTAGPVLAIDASGRLVSGEDNGNGVVIRRFDTDGTPDASFGTAGVAQTTLGFTITSGQQEHQLSLSSISVSKEGQIYLGGNLFVSQDPTTYHHAIVARLTTTGAVDTAFSGDGVVEYDSSDTTDNFISATDQVAATPDGGVLVLYRNADANGDRVYKLTASGTSRDTAAVTSSQLPQLFAEPDGGFLLSDGSYVSRYTASGKYNGTFGHVRIGADSDQRTLSTDGTLYSVSQTSTTDKKGIYTYTLHAYRRFIDDGPAANLNIADLTTAPVGSYVFTVQYRDADGVLRSSLGNDDLRLVLPDGSTARAVFVKADTSANGKVINATYKIAPVGGSWSSADDGLYGIALNANAVSSIDGGISDAATLGYFRIELV